VTFNLMHRFRQTVAKSTDDGWRGLL